jgi:hypothetical protein
MSFKLKQRFGEVLAIALIVTIVGFLVYMLVPTNPKTPKSEPVTVRSTAKLETQSHVAVASEQTPPNGQVLQETTVKSVSQTTPSEPTAVVSGDADKYALTKRVTQQQNSNAQGAIAVTIKAACASLPKAVAGGVGSVLQAIPVVGGLVSGITSCAS